ncbi:MAG: dihydrolipoyl dehydrogenase [Candidatus Marinamargulisbacteria bacterium]
MNKEHRQSIVIGSGPGGYAAAFYLADHGHSVTLIEKEDLGGVCLNRGCIPSKALLNIAGTIDKTAKGKDQGLTFSKPKIDLDTMREWKNSVVEKLRSGVAGLAKARKVDVIQGRAVFDDAATLRVETGDTQTFYTFDNLIIATGSRPMVPGVMDLGNPRIMTSTEALDIEDIPNVLLVVGGGYIGMELGSVYASLGSKVSVVEALPEILAGADSDLVKVFQKYVSKKMDEMMLSHKVKKMATKGKKIEVEMETPDNKTIKKQYDKVLVSVGRLPNSDDLALDNTDIQLDERGCIKINDQCQTAVPNIYAIGDVAGGIQLAHKATKEAKIAAETILGNPTLPLAEFVIPAVVFTDPEIAWVGLTEKEAKADGITVDVSKFPWTASGRALTLNRTEGLTKVVSDPATGRVLGVGIVGDHAGDLISEAVMVVQSGMTVVDLAESIHPHPTLSESLMESAENALGHCTHMMPSKKLTHI